MGQVAVEWEQNWTIVIRKSDESLTFQQTVEICDTEIPS